MHAVQSRALINTRKIAVLCTIFGAITACAWAIIASSMSWQRGIYAGFHYNDAKRYVVRQLSDQFPEAVGRLRYLGEDKTHLIGGMGSQVRVFHFVDPEKVSYCALIWGGSGANRHVFAAKGKSCAKKNLP